MPERFTAVSNGELRRDNRERAAKTRTFHWRHDVPHSSYLMSLAAGEFALIEERAGNTPVTYYVAPGREDDARRAFGNTPRMIQFFEKAIGVPYPYAKYAQVAVSRFHFRRDGKHFGDDADRRHAARRARASRFHQRPAGRARAGASMVGRSADLPRLVARVAERGLRDVLRGAVVRGGQGRRRVRVERAPGSEAISTRTRSLSAADRVPTSIARRSSCSIVIYMRRAAWCCTCCGARSATSCFSNR